MWAFFSRRFRRYLIFALGAPIVSWLLERLGQGIETRRGESGVTRGLRSAGGWLHGQGRGPLAKRQQRRPPNSW